MINIGTLLDACGISYTDKQLKKLDRLFNHLVKGHIFKNFPGISSKDNSYKDLRKKLAIHIWFKFNDWCRQLNQTQFGLIEEKIR